MNSIKDNNNIYNNYIFFWGVKHKYGYLSNFYISEFIINGDKYCCSEQYFMKIKQETFDKDNIELANKIMSETKPTIIKKLGRQVKNYDDDKWSKIKYKIMKKALLNKFQQNYIIKELLINTNDKIIVEASPFDKEWGIGLSEINATQFLDFPQRGL